MFSVNCTTFLKCYILIVFEIIDILNQLDDMFWALVDKHYTIHSVKLYTGLWNKAIQVISILAYEDSRNAISSFMQSTNV